MQQNAAGIDMTFEAFCGLYEKDRRPRLKESTWLTKENIIKNKLIPAFRKMMMSEIETKLIPKEHQTPAPEKLVSQINQQAQGSFFIIQRLLNRGDTKGSPHNHSTMCWL